LQPRARSLVTARIDVFVIDKSSNKPVRDARSLLSRSIKSEHGGQIQTLAICGMSSSPRQPPQPPVHAFRMIRRHPRPNIELHQAENELHA
jgi:hypothetical protein